MHLRQEFGSVLGERYVKHAKAMGLSPLSEAKRDLINRSWRVLFSRGTALLSGTIVVEQIFGVRGIGYLIFNAANYKHADSMFLILGCSVIFVIVINCVHYFLTLLIDPRLRES
jgi:ABC-type dipeptide/oligopeptide/nickel transport system permease component